MKEQTLKSWEDFEQALVEINDRREQFHKRHGYKLYPHFRGVSNSKYHLESTLDRTKKGMSLSDYHVIIKIIHKHVVTCTGKEWNLETKVNLGRFDLKAYEFMAYLRHDGFPSPLIDWTKSPYIAAFFAFRDIYSEANHKKDDVFAAECPVLRDICTKYVSIFCGLWNLQCGDKSHIYTLGHTIATHRNHYLQQSEYSICVREGNKNIYFANHEDIEENEEEGVLIKYNIPVSEQQKVLRKLDSMNITAYSLFGSEPSLMETLALREIVLK